MDVETTGLDPNKDEIIELAIVPFFYAINDEIVGVGEAFSALRQPTSPIPAEVMKLTGIDDAMVAGRAVDPADVAAFAGGNLIIVHYAPFDRGFVERFCPALVQNPWACSMSEVRWAENSPFESKDILKQRGYRWNGDDNGQPRAWWIDVREADIESEKAFLCAEVYRRDTTFRTATITAFTRHSSRIIPA